MTRISALILAISLLVAPAAFAQEAAVEPTEPTGETLSADEVTELFTGNTEEDSVVMKRGQETGRVYQAYYNDDGTYLMKEKTGFVHGGVWFVDPLGRMCFRPGGKDKTKCDVIVREGDHFIRLREGGLRGRFTMAKGDPHNLTASGK